MAKKPKRKLTGEQRRARKRRRKETMIIFINGKQKRVPRPPKIDGLDADEFIRRNADPIWLVQNGEWDELHRREMEGLPDEDYDWLPATVFGRPVAEEPIAFRGPLG